MRKAPGYLALLGGLAVLVGALGPWIPHQAVGLRVSGFDLFEMARIFPPVRAGAIRVAYGAFVLPLLLSALAFALAPVLDRALPTFLRWLCPALGVVLALTALPPYPAILTAYRDPTYRGRFYTTAGAALLAAAAPLLRRLPRGLVGGGLLVLTVVGSAWPLVQYGRLRPLFEPLYGQPLGVGWGVIAHLVGAALLLLAGAVALWPSRHPDEDAV